MRQGILGTEAFPVVSVDEWDEKHKNAAEPGKNSEHGDTAKMAKKKAPDPLLIEIEQALRPGRFIPYDQMFHFVGQLHPVEEKLVALVAGGEAPARIKF